MSDMATEQEMSKSKKRAHLETVYWAGVLIWAGLIFGVDSLGVLPQVGQADAWSWVFFGAGLYALLGAFWRVALPDQPNPTAWDYVWAAILLILGLSGLTALEIGLPLILVVVGIVLLGSALLRRA